MKMPKGSMQLSRHESVRLQLLLSTDRDRAVEAITRYLRGNIAQGGVGSGPRSPDQWYRPRKRR